VEPDLFLQEKPVKALIALSDQDRTWYAHLLAKEIDCSYAHLVKVLNSFEGDGLVNFNRTGRIKVVSITDKGSELAHDLKSVLLRLSKWKTDVKAVKE
jgi:DNA-binding MarR family transcriptional regulator